jgi:hypothetical protein
MQICAGFVAFGLDDERISGRTISRPRLRVGRHRHRNIRANCGKQAEPGRQDKRGGSIPTP